MYEVIRTGPFKRGTGSLVIKAQVQERVSRLALMAVSSAPDSNVLGDDEGGALRQIRLLHAKGKASTLGLRVVRKRGPQRYWLLPGANVAPYQRPLLMTLEQLEFKLSELESATKA